MSCQEEIIAAIISDSPHSSSNKSLCDVDLIFFFQSVTGGNTDALTKVKLIIGFCYQSKSNPLFANTHP